MATHVVRAARIVHPARVRCFRLRRWLACLVVLFIVLGARQLAGIELLVEVTKAEASAESRGTDPSGGSSARRGAAASDKPHIRLREGAKFHDELGEFQKSGDRYSFCPQSGKAAIRVLENLALQRIASVLGDDLSPRMWSISGVVTEYCGENFLLVTRAVLKSRRSESPQPETPAENKGQPVTRARPRTNEAETRAIPPVGSRKS